MMYGAREDLERFAAISSHALKGSWVLGARAGRDMALAKFMN